MMKVYEDFLFTPAGKQVADLIQEMCGRDITSGLKSLVQSVYLSGYADGLKRATKKLDTPE